MRASTIIKKCRRLKNRMEAGKPVERYEVQRLYRAACRCHRSPGPWGRRLDGLAAWKPVFPAERVAFSTALSLFKKFNARQNALENSHHNLEK